jgi:hypothetical protein
LSFHFLLLTFRLTAPKNVAPSLHEAQQALLKQKTEDLLNQHLQNRPLPHTLVTQNIIPEGLQPSPSVDTLSSPLSRSSHTAQEEEEEDEEKEAK